MRDPTDLLQQEADAEADEADALTQAQQEAEDIKWLMSTKAGQRFAWRLMARTQVHCTPFAATDAQTNFNCGERNVGLWFLNELMAHCPESYLAMLKERATT